MSEGKWDEKRCDDRHEEERRYQDLLTEKHKEEIRLTRDLLNSQLEMIKEKLSGKNDSFLDLRVSTRRVLNLVAYIISLVVVFLTFNARVEEKNITQENRITKIETKMDNIENEFKSIQRKLWDKY